MAADTAGETQPGYSEVTGLIVAPAIRYINAEQLVKSMFEDGIEIVNKIERANTGHSWVNIGASAEELEGRFKQWSVSLARIIFFPTPISEDMPRHLRTLAEQEAQRMKKLQVIKQSSVQSNAT